MTFSGSAVVVHDDEEVRDALRGVLEGLRVRVEAAANADVARRLLVERVADVVVLPSKLGGESALAFVTELAAAYADVHLVVIGTGDPADVIEALRLGASDVLHDPRSKEEVTRLLGKVLVSVENVEGPPNRATADGKLVGDTPAMKALKEKIDRAGKTTATVLIRGESGTGKELVAQRIHDVSGRQGGFVKVHCAALPEALLESELFGYVKGAFTGATGDKVGRVALAEGGTLFLDEIGDVPLPIQVKLLRLLQEREYEALGDAKPRKADVRFVTATHRDLEGMVKRGEFREDLFYRLNVVPLWVPPLRTRRGDVATLARVFVARFGERYGRALTLSDSGLAALEGHRWPGNIRQLQNLVERLVVLTEGDVIDEAAVKRELTSETPAASAQASAVSGASAAWRTRADIVVTRSTTSGEVVPLAESLMKAERVALERALRRTKGNRTLAAKLLGVSRGTLYNKLEAHGLR